MNLNDLQTFVLVAEVGTFSGVADQLGVPKSTVSRRVSRLEGELGLALLNRSSRSFVLSDDGRALYARCAPALRDIADIERDLVDSEASPRGQLRVTASIDFGTTTYLSDLLATYARRFPDVQVALAVTNRVVDLLEEGIDVGFRTHGARLPSRDDLVARKLGTLAIGVFASPAYVRERGPIETVDALDGHATVSHSTAYLADWPVLPTLTANDYQPVAAMLAAGAGVGVLPDFVAAPYLESGDLVRVALDWAMPPVALSLVWLRSRHLAPRVRAFIDLAVERARGTGWCR